MPKHLYIHMPFCRKKCVYCDFYSVYYSQTLASQYIAVLAKQVKSRKEKFTTIYLGGGTPSILSLALLEKLLKSLSKKLTGDYEFTVEANPESLTKDKLKTLSDYGVNRISLGAQSFDDKNLKKLGRIHSAAQGLAAIEQSLQQGFRNISIDLIFGLEQQNVKTLTQELKQAIALPIKHISCYALTVEPGTKLSCLVKQAEFRPASEDLVVLMYRKVMDFLPRHKFFQYEVSNFAQLGWESKHNLAYWDNQQYLGLGPSAYSYVNGIRFKYTDSLTEYIRLINAQHPAIVFSEKLDQLAKAREVAAFKIRTKAGIDFSWFKQVTGYDFLQLYPKDLDHLVKQKLVSCSKTRLSLTKKGFLFADQVSSSLV